MADIYLTNRDGGKTDEAGHYHFLANAFTGNVVKGLTLAVSSPLSMKLKVQAGDARVPYGNYAYTVFIDDSNGYEITFDTADPSNPRIDRVVLYVDRAATPSPATPNNPGIAKIAIVKGTAAGSPTRPSDITVNTAVSNNPWIDLADVRVNAGVTTIDSAKITDKRSLYQVPTSGIAESAVTANKIEVQQTWQTPALQNGWVNYGSPFDTAGYMKDSLGFVHLKGLVKSGTLGQTIFTLPVGYRPTATLRFASDSNGAHGSVTIDATGIITSSGSNIWVFLDPVNFKAA